MMHRSYMRRGVSLEVIVEEDDNAEVSLDPVHYQDESDSNSSSPALSIENDNEKFTKEMTCNRYDQNCDDLDDKLRQEKQKRRKKKEERWRNLERQRSLSCETLTVLDVGDDEFSREQWEVETRDWDSENPNTRSEIEQSISRRKILASRLEYQDKYNSDYQSEIQDKYDPDYPEETRVDNEFDEVEMENGRCRNPNKATKGIDEDSGDSETEAIQEDKDEINGLEDDEDEEDNSEDEKQVEQDDKEDEDYHIKLNPFNTFKDDNNPEYIDTELAISNSTQMVPPSWPQEPFSTGEDSWITVGELEDGAEEDQCENDVGENDDGENPTVPSIPTPTTTPTDNLISVEELSCSPKMKQKGVRFSDQVEFVHEQGKETLQEDIKPQQIKPKRVNFTNEISINDETESQNTKINQTHSEIQHDKLVSVKAGRHLFEKKTAGRVCSPLAERLTAVLETPDIMIVERTYSQDDDETVASQNQDRDEATSPETTSSLSAPSNNPQNVDPDELPPPNTVASVRQLFEKLPTFTLRNIRQFNTLTRYDHVRSNPTSKILRFDRHEQTNSTPLEKPRTTPEAVPSPPPQSNAIKFTPEMLVNAQKKNYTPRPPEDYSSTGVHLRKPQIAHGFDVRKALMENPRYFHIRVNEKGKKEEKIMSDCSKNSSVHSNNNTGKGKRNTVTYSYLEAKHQRHSGNTTSLRWTKESIDRSDSESMCSESSEDSGVSRDFTSSILSSFSTSTKKKKPKWRDPNLLQEEYGSDPSFKWIDPTVLAKIRSRGTTVIYFGPRHRHQGTLQSRSTRRTIHENLPLFDDIQKEEPATKGIVNNVDVDSTEQRNRRDAQYDKEDFNHTTKQMPSNSGNARPKIVGVMHKKNSSMGEMTSIVNKTCNNKNQFKPKPFLHTDSRIIHMKELKKKSAGENSIVYDFTEKQA